MHRPTGNADARRGFAVRFASCALLCALALAPPAGAELSDRDKPINLEADRMEIDDAKKVATLTGNVIVTQGTLVLRAERMVLTQDADGFQKGVAYGNPATFRQKREGFDEYIDGSAQRMEYDGNSEKLELFDRAVVRKGGEEVRGNYISYNARTEFYQASGSGKDATGKETPGRVRAIIIPKKKEDEGPVSAPAPSSTVPLKPTGNLARPPEQ